MSKYGRWSLEEIAQLQADGNVIEGLPHLNRENRRELARRVAKIRKPMIVDEPVKPLDERICGAPGCGQLMGLHPKPNYYPCPIGVIDGMGVSVS